MNSAKGLADIKDPNVSEIGGKGYSLAILIKRGFNVPPGFVIASKVFFEFLKYNNLTKKIERLASEIKMDNFKEKSSEIRRSILQRKISRDIKSDIEIALNKLNAEYISVRSSGVSEDSLKASFAGMHDTFLNVKSDINLVLESIKKCWASLFTERAVVYRIREKLPHLEGMAVVIQEMILPEVSGITFTLHPSNEKNLLVEASFGIGDVIVSGKVEPDEYVVDRETGEVLNKKIGDKNRMSTVENEEIKIVDVKNEFAEKQVLLDEKAREIARSCLKIEKTFNSPQDIEWCISNDKLWFLQSRPITGL